MLFNTLIPALSFTIVLGLTATGSTQMYVDVITGTLNSEPGFEPSVTATAVRGGDWISTDPPTPNSNATVLRLGVDVLVKVDGDVEEDEYIRMRCTGAELATPEVAAIVGGDRNVPPVKFGDFQATSSWTFETASKKYWDLQNAVFVGSTSVRAGEDEGTFVVGFKIAKVVSAKTDVSV
ncbi:uncharacterized protein ALTATR162_LOCUS5614 [Alternaria atra]|uniref:Uncharacterized protein n=1 Tax=Alternaria atra TaxID=119953 RepID=A0A8J2N659_9PLEO|nr:uncharacterized protein ALTATR162_LOCUS5614 [Alternaria atra]CAG5159503.1 unnamed protein product [Alternaria atra]